MSYIQLTGGSYKSRSLISAAQRCLNLYPEVMPDAQGEPSPLAHNCTPGLTLLSTAPEYPIRCLYTASNGDLYACADQGIYYVDPKWAWHLIGTIHGTALSDQVTRRNPVSMADNGVTLMIVDGSVDGWLVNLVSRGNFTRIDRTTQTGFYGGTSVQFSDTFFILNQPGTPNFYVSGSEDVTFDPLDFAAKAAKSDVLVNIVVEHRVIWLLGRYSTEIWFNTGGNAISASSGPNNFPYEPIPGTFFPRGLAAPYSLARTDNQIFWLSQDQSGQGVVMRGVGYNAQRISTHSIETEFSGYARIDDAIGMTYQQQGHTFYMLSFPTADKTWVCDVTNPQTAEWHERCWLDGNTGQEHRHRANAMTFAYKTNVVGDHEEGFLYSFDLNNYTDNGNPIKRLVTFPHMIDPEANRRVMYKQFVANMQVGTSQETSNSQVVIHTAFAAPDGTLLEDYIGTGDIGSQFTKVGDGEGEIVSNQLIAETGASEYLASGIPTSPDYSVAFKATPTNYAVVSPAGTLTYAIGRAVAPDYNGYKVSVSSNGGIYVLDLIVMGSAIDLQVPLGTLTSGYYAVTMNLQTSLITVSVQRSQDNHWLAATGAWVTSETTAISLSDTTYGSIGRVVIGVSGGVSAATNQSFILSGVAAVGETTGSETGVLNSIGSLQTTVAIGGISDLLVTGMILDVTLADQQINSAVSNVSINVSSAAIADTLTGAVSTGEIGAVGLTGVTTFVVTSGVAGAASVGMITSVSNINVNDTVNMLGVAGNGRIGSISSHLLINQSANLIGVVSTGRVGSPSLSVTIGGSTVGPTASGSLLTVDFTATSGQTIDSTGTYSFANQPIARTLWGVSMIAPAANNFAAFAQVPFQTQAQKVPFSLYRLSGGAVSQGASTRSQIPLGASVGLWWGDSFQATGDMVEQDPLATTQHYNNFKSAMGRAPSVLASVGTNPADTGFGAPNQWPGTDIDQWPSGVPKSGVAPCLTWVMGDGSINNAFSIFANGATTFVAGQTVDYWVRQVLQRWKDGGFTKLYIRPQWEFNQNFFGGGIRNAGDVGNFLAAWKHWANVVHQFAIDNGMTIKTVWCPSISNQIEAACYGLPCVAFYPTPDSGAVGGKYVDVVGPDVYAFGGDPNGTIGMPSPDLNVSSNQYWCFSSMVQLAQTYNATLAICELGDFSTGQGLGSQIAWQSWIPNFVNYVNSLNVPWEFISLFDLTTSGAFQFIHDAPTNSDLMAWRNCLGLTGTNPTPVLTNPVP